MYIATVPNRNSKPTVLLRETWREGKKVHKRTLANLTSWPEGKIEALRKLLKDELPVDSEPTVVVERSIPHGHVEAVLTAIRKTALETMISSRRRREEDLVIAMIATRLLHPDSEPHAAGLWRTTTLAEELGVDRVEEGDFHTTLDWLLAKQGRVEKILAAQRLSEGGTAFYYVTGNTCDNLPRSFSKLCRTPTGMEDRPAMVCGMLTDAKGCPVAVDAYPGTTDDLTLVPHMVEKLRERFGLEHIVIIGDRRTLNHLQIERLKDFPHIGWISALRFQAIRKLVQGENACSFVFDGKDLAETDSTGFPGERLIACFRKTLGEERSLERQELLKATEEELSKIAHEVSQRAWRPLAKLEIARKVGKVLSRFRMGKYFVLTIEDGTFSYARKYEAIECDARLDGLNVIRTSEPSWKIAGEDAVRGYKDYARVEHALQGPKGPDLLVRPIRQRSEDHVRGHLFLSLLAYYVEWHMRQALAPLVSEEEPFETLREGWDLSAPVEATEKEISELTFEGLPVQSFKALLAEMGTLCRNRCRIGQNSDGVLFHCATEQTELQKKAFDLLEAYDPYRVEAIAGNIGLSESGYRP
ncbi:MAG: IS1634 family transposase [Syntrophobacteraceae bacterium]